MMNSHELLAEKLDALPNGYPPAADGAHLRLLEKIFSPQEAEFAALLTPEPETIAEIAARTGRDSGELRGQLKDLAKRGLINVTISREGARFCLLPFVVGIYENQIGTLDEEMARLFEDYYNKSFAEVMRVQPQFHRVVPVGETIANDMEIQPYESVNDIVSNAKSWAVFDCICRKQKALIGEGCDHPLDVCMAFSPSEGAFENHPVFTAVSHSDALAALRRAADAGLVHSVSNTKEGLHYVCNCCTCSCGILQGIARLGTANVIARSAFVCTVDEDLCTACGACVEYCQFDALSLDLFAQVDRQKCVGCGVCVPNCPTDALRLVRRPEEEILPIPETHADWGSRRAAARG